MAKRRPPGRCSRPGAGPQRPWPTIRQPAQTAPLQPTAAARLLSVRAAQHDADSRDSTVPTTSRNALPVTPMPRPSSPSPAAHRRPLGPPTVTVRSKLHSSTYSSIHQPIRCRGQYRSRGDARHGALRPEGLHRPLRLQGSSRTFTDRLPLPVRGDHPASGPDPNCRPRCHRNRDDGSLPRLCPPRPDRPGRLGPFDPCSGPRHRPEWSDGS